MESRLQPVKTHLYRTSLEGFRSCLFVRFGRLKAGLHTSLAYLCRQPKGWRQSDPSTGIEPIVPVRASHSRSGDDCTDDSGPNKPAWGHTPPEALGHKPVAHRRSVRAQNSSAHMRLPAG
jgi:hypothetical protein